MGHTVLVVPVPALDDVVRERTAYYDSSFVSADPKFAHAHITLLGPWAEQPSEQELGCVARIAEAAKPFSVDRIDLQWWANHECRRLHTWPLGCA